MFLETRFGFITNMIGMNYKMIGLPISNLKTKKANLF